MNEMSAIMGGPEFKPAMNPGKFSAPTQMDMSKVWQSPTGRADLAAKTFGKPTPKGQDKYGMSSMLEDTQSLLGS